MPRRSLLDCLRTLMMLAVAAMGAPAGALAQSASPSPGPVADAFPPALAQQIDAAAKQVLAASGVPSASVAIVREGRIAYLQAYGQARLSPAVDAQPRMQYSIGSISKQFTAAAVLLLAERRKLSLDDPVARYLPGLTRAEEVTLRMLLSHTSGYEDYWPEDYVMTSLMVPTTAQHILDVWGKKPLNFDPGTKWQYSNTNYVIAGRIVEQVSGVPLLAFLENNIFAPLAMEKVYDSDASHLPATDPEGYYRHALGPLRPAPQEGAGWMFAAGELAMPAHDLALWDISLIDRSLLKPASYAQMLTPVLLKDGTSSGYGLGVFLGRRDGHAVIEHDGEVSGFVSENLVFPEDRAAIVVLTNEDASPAAITIGRRLTPLVLGLRPPAPTSAESQALAIFLGLEDGRLNRKLFTPLCNAYFTAQAIDDFATSLKPLGPPLSFTQQKQEARGGMIFRSFTAEFPDRKLTVTTYEMPDGKLEQYLVIP
ncbi:MAG TPA: serine hydrolase domain-containing protein [Acidobacteriaceae bacterium]|nr:serine hydrolase domain-containing protein [Acidobacteriaceae bacterium]